MSAGTNPPMFKSTWDATREKWGRRNLDEVVQSWEIEEELVQIFGTEKQVRRLYRLWILSGHWWKPEPEELKSFALSIVEG